MPIPPPLQLFEPHPPHPVAGLLDIVFFSFRTIGRMTFFSAIFSSNKVYILKLSDERGIRTPEVRSTTGLAILRHTGLGYLVMKNERFPRLPFLMLSMYLTLFHKVAGAPQVAVIHIHK